MRVFTRINSVIAIWSVLICGQANAKVTLDTSGKGELVNLYGEINRGDAEQFATIVGSGQVKVPLLILQNSTGGDANAAMDIGRIARKNNFVVWVMDKCLSACALIYIAGVDRKNFGIIGLHRPYFVGGPMPTSQVATATQKMLSDIRKYAADMNVTEEFADIIINTDPASMRTYVKDEIEQIVPEYDPVYGELMAAYWARTYGISTEEYRRRDANAKVNCNDPAPSDVPGITVGQMCALATRWGMAVSTFEPLYKLALQKCGTVDATSLPNLAASNWDNPALIQNETCLRNAMLTPQRTVHFVIEPRFAGASSFQEDVARVDDGAWHAGFIDRQGRYVISPDYIDARPFQNGLAAVQVADGKKDQFGAPTGKWGFINKQGRMVISPQYSQVDSFQSGLAAAQVGGKWGFIDRTGKFIIRPQFDWAESFHDGLALVNVGSRRFGFIDANMHIVVQPRFDPANSFQEGLAEVGTPKGVGFIDRSGKFVINPNPLILMAEPFHEGLSVVQYSSEANGGGISNFGFIDKRGTVVIKPHFYLADSFQQGIAAVCADVGQCGFIDKLGNFVISPRFQAAKSFSQGLAAVQVGGKWGYIAW